MQDVTAAIVVDNGNVLIARRAGGKHAGWWEFPGGKVEPGESPERCLQRELAEEFGVEAKVGEFVTESIYDYGRGTIRLLAYRVDLASLELKLIDHDRVMWVRPGELSQHRLLPADRPIAETLI